MIVSIFARSGIYIHKQKDGYDLVRFECFDCGWRSPSYIAADYEILESGCKAHFVSCTSKSTAIAIDMDDVSQLTRLRWNLVIRLARDGTWAQSEFSK